MAILRRKNRIIISGPVLIGFNELFDSSFGDPRTPQPYPKITPSRMGGALLPFACPHCEDVRAEVVAVGALHHYHDKDRGHSWCPSCSGRYVVDFKGAPLVGALPAGALSAPARVDRGGKLSILGAVVESGLHLLGVC